MSAAAAASDISDFCFGYPAAVLSQSRRVRDLGYKEEIEKENWREKVKGERERERVREREREKFGEGRKKKIEAFCNDRKKKKRETMN